MTAKKFVADVERLGYTLHNVAPILGIARSSVFRYANGEAAVPPYVEKLIAWYLRHGVPEQE